MRFGPSRTLDLHRGSPTGAQAVARLEAWLREQQALGATELLVITGRGKGSVDRAAVIRPAVEAQLRTLATQGVVASHQAHNAGAFVVTLQPFRAAVRARRAPSTPAPAPPTVPDPPALRALPADLRDALRTLALASLDDLGVQAPTPAQLADEMQARFAALSAAAAGAPDPAAALRAAIRAALDAV
jgi:hypothetical protein